jgi:hypothetical protein
MDADQMRTSTERRIQELRGTDRPDRKKRLVWVDFHVVVASGARPFEQRSNTLPRLHSS